LQTKASCCGYFATVFRKFSPIVSPKRGYCDAPLEYDKLEIMRLYSMFLKLLSNSNLTTIFRKINLSNTRFMISKRIVFFY